MGLSIDKPAIDEMIEAFIGLKADELQTIIGGKWIETERDGTTLIVPDPAAMIREYGTATVAPDPWAMQSLQEMGE